MSKSPDVAPKDIFDAINKIREKVGYIKKDEAHGLNYSFISESSLLKATRPFFVLYGVVIYVSNVQIISQSEYVNEKPIESKSGEVYVKKTYMFNKTILMTVTFRHVDSGTEFSVQVSSEGTDMGDKALPKAMTMGMKYAIRQTLVLESGDDGDREEAVNVTMTPLSMTLDEVYKICEKIGTGDDSPIWEVIFKHNNNKRNFQMIRSLDVAQSLLED